MNCIADTLAPSSAVLFVHSSYKSISGSQTFNSCEGMNSLAIEDSAEIVLTHLPVSNFCDDTLEF